MAVLLLAAVLGGAGWLWWQESHTRKFTPERRPSPTMTVTNRKGNPIVPSLVLVERVPAPEAGTQAVMPVASSLVSNLPVVAPPLATIPLLSAAAEYPRPVRNLLEAQIALARLAISPGALDGRIGSQTRSAVLAFHHLKGLPATRELDTNILAALTLDSPSLADYVVTTNDTARLQPLGKSWLAKSRQSVLEYETILELVAEKGHAYQSLIQKLNPDLDWTKVAVGTAIKIPAVAYPAPPDRAACVVIHLSERFMEALDTTSNLMAHFPCSIAARVDKRPVGELHVAVIAPNPNYTLDPAIFVESPEVQAIGRKIVLPPGPNNPVGVAWIGLDKPGYGMHGTPNPEQIGRTESHGCFRLANWDAEYLLRLVWIGMPVYVEP